MTDIREFMTGWFSDGDSYSGPRIEKGHMLAWSERRKPGLMGKARGKHFVPKFRPFDMLSEPNQTVLLLTNEDQRIVFALDDGVVVGRSIAPGDHVLDDIALGRVVGARGHSPARTARARHFECGPARLLLRCPHPLHRLVQPGENS